jgi:chorismate mutase
VANPEHVEQCLKHGIDVLWVGARTTGNPFSVQAIAEALKGVDIPVMIKNPMNPDLELWIGAVERLNRAGIKRLAAIHRGFGYFKVDMYRNTPSWAIPIELKRRIPDIPIICDPSHICGRTDLLLTVAQKALDLLYDGLMIEVHINPKAALSDANQQLRPEELGDLMRRLQVKRSSSSSAEFLAQISSLRKEIDEIDSRLIELLAKRMEIVERIGICKKRNNVALFQPSRWEEMVKERIRIAAGWNLPEELILRLFQCIHEESINLQDKMKD